MSSGQPLTTASLNEINQTLQNYEFGLKQELQRLNPIPQSPVIDTQEQIDFLNNLPQQQKSTIRQQMDTARQRIGLPGLETQRVDLMNQALAANQAYQKILDDINANPDLPKGLAKRRLEEVDKMQKSRLLQIKGQLEIVNQQISDSNDSLNREFQIVQAEKSEEERQRDNARQFVQQLISTGTLGVLSPQELNQLAGRLGVDNSVMTQMAEAVKKSAGEYSSFSTQTDDAGNVSIIGIKRDGTANIVKTISGVGETSVSERTTTAKAGLLAASYPVLNDSKGTDGFVDPGVYMQERQKFVSQFGSSNEFDEVFAPMLSIQQRINLGVGKTSL